MPEPLPADAANPDLRPSYQRIKDYVLQQIASGVWSQGDLIPTELALCAMFGVSRMTVNRALRELTAEQLLVRYKGSGTYVAQPKYQSTLIEIRSIAQDIRDRGHTHASQVLKLESRAATYAQALRFRIEPKSRLFHSIIVHFEDGVPIQVEDRHVSAAMAPDYMAQDWERMTPGEYLLRVAPLPTGQYTIEVRDPPAQIAEVLAIDAAQACLVLDRITYSRNAFTTHVTMWHPGNRYRFSGKI
jgi:GntR family histidine utilization transcriptional repressor